MTQLIGRPDVPTGTPLRMTVTYTAPYPRGDALGLGTMTYTYDWTDQRWEYSDGTVNNLIAARYNTNDPMPPLLRILLRVGSGAGTIGKALEVPAAETAAGVLSITTPLTNVPYITGPELSALIASTDTARANANTAASAANTAAGNANTAASAANTAAANIDATITNAASTAATNAVASVQGQVNTALADIAQSEARANAAAAEALSLIGVNPIYVSQTTANPINPSSGNPYGARQTAEGGWQRLYWTGSTWQPQGSPTASYQTLSNALATRVSLATIYPDIDLTGQSVEHTRLQTALTRMHDLYGGGTLTLPTGSLMIDPNFGGATDASGDYGLVPLTIPSGVNVQGAGYSTVLKLRPDTAITQAGPRKMLIVNSDSVVSGLRLDGQRNLIPAGRTYGTYGIIVNDNAERVTIRDCWAHDIGAAQAWESFGFVTRSRTSGLRFVNCHAWNITGTGFNAGSGQAATGDIFSNASADLVIDGCTAHDCTWMGLGVFFSRRATITNCHAWNNQSHGINCEYNTDLIVTGNHSYGNKRSGITIAGVSRNVQVRGNITHHNNTENVAWAGGINITGFAVYTSYNPAGGPTNASLGAPVDVVVEGNHSYANGVQDYLEQNDERPYSTALGNPTQTTPPYGWANGWGHRLARVRWLLNSTSYTDDSGAVLPCLYTLAGTDGELLTAGGAGALPQITNPLFSGPASAPTGWTVGGNAQISKVADTATYSGQATRLTVAAGSYSSVRWPITVPSGARRLLLAVRLKAPAIGALGVAMTIQEASAPSRVLINRRQFTSGYTERQQRQDELADYRTYLLPVDFRAQPADISRSLNLIIGNFTNTGGGTEYLDIDWAQCWFEFAGGTHPAITPFDPRYAAREGGNTLSGMQVVQETSTTNNSTVQLWAKHTAPQAGARDIGWVITNRAEGGGGNAYIDLRTTLANGSPQNILRIFAPLGGANWAFGAAVTHTDYNVFSGAVTFQARIDIRQMVRLPSTATTVTATTTLAATHSLMLLTSTANVTLGNAPTIVAGRDGEQVAWLNTGAFNITLQDRGTLAGSALMLGANTRVLAPRQNITLIYSTALSAWVETGYTAVL